jgi:outer membrane protein TolC
LSKIPSQSSYRDTSTTARHGVTVANKSFERIEARYGVGAATFLDVTTAQVVLAQAQAAEAQAQIDVHLQAQVLRHVVGAAD